MENIKLEELVGGAIQEKFQNCFNNVLENMLDLNTSYKAERSITIKLSFKQNEQRDDIKAHIDVKEKLAPQAAIETSFSFAKDLETGEIMVEEYGKQIKGQLSLKDVQPTIKVVDTETGEILEDSNVVDLRRKA